MSPTVALELAFALALSCTACAHMPAGRCCLSHTCPDCGQPASAATNASGELIHDCS